MGRILLISNEEEVAESVPTDLAPYGYSTAVYTDPLLALKEFKPDFYDLVVIDIRLAAAGVNSFFVCRELAKKDRQVNVCFLTAIEVRKKEFDLLFADLDVKFFLTKPLSVAALMEHLPHAQIIAR